MDIGYKSTTGADGILKITSVVFDICKVTCTYLLGHDSTLNISSLQ